MADDNAARAESVDAAMDHAAKAAKKSKKQRRTSEDGDAAVTRKPSALLGGHGRDPFGHSYSETNLVSLDKAAQTARDLAGGEEGSTEDLSGDRKAIMGALIKQIKPGSEVKSLTLPMFVCDLKSTLEAFGDRFLFPETYLPLSDMNDPTERLLQFIKFYLSGWHLKPPGVKKPFNPIIGEVFDCVIGTSVGAADVDSDENADDKFTHYISEQIAHHPPITGLVAYNVQAGVAARAVVQPAYAKFYGNSAESKMFGTCYIHVFGKGWEITYACTFPSFNVRGILMGQLCVEVKGKTEIRVVSGKGDCGPLDLSAEIEFKSKGMFGGKFNQLGGEVRKGKDVLYTLTGAWDSEVQIAEGPAKKKAKPTQFVDIKKLNLGIKKYPEIASQGDNFSHKVWEQVLKPAREKRDADAMNAKLDMEAKQRAEEKARHDAKKDYPHQFWHDSSKSKASADDEKLFVDSSADEDSIRLNAYRFTEFPHIIERIRKAGRGAK